MAIVRVLNVIKIMARYYYPLSDTALNLAYGWTVENDYELKDLLNEDVAEALITEMSAFYR